MKRILLASLVLLAGFASQAHAADTVYYYYNDAQGSPVAVTDAHGTVVERTQYAPYGQVLNRPEHDGPGYTKHEEDAATGLTNMQQRYDDKVIGRMLSMDPMDVETTTGSNFNRYAYAADNPYRFIDPDGRQTTLDCGANGCFPADAKGGTGTMIGVVADANMAVAEGQVQDQTGSAVLTGRVRQASVAAAGQQAGTPPTHGRQQRTAPSRLVILPNKTENKGSYSFYYYQLVDSNGRPLTSDGYSALEQITPHSLPGVKLTIQQQFGPLNQGVYKDQVGFQNGPPGRNIDSVVYQTFIIRYAGADYVLPTMFKHEMQSNDGVVTNSVTDVSQ